MTQMIDTELKELIQALDKKIDAGFAEIKADIKVIDTRLIEVEKKIGIIDTRLIEVEKKIDKQDGRLWGFMAIILTAALGTIWKVVL